MNKVYDPIFMNSYHKTYSSIFFYFHKNSKLTQDSIKRKAKNIERIALYPQ